MQYDRAWKARVYLPKQYHRGEAAESVPTVRLLPRSRSDAALVCLAGTNEVCSPRGEFLSEHLCPSKESPTITHTYYAPPDPTPTRNSVLSDAIRCDPAERTLQSDATAIAVYEPLTSASPSSCIVKPER